MWIQMDHQTTYMGNRTVRVNRIKTISTNGSQRLSNSCVRANRRGNSFFWTAKYSSHWARITEPGTTTQDADPPTRWLSSWKIEGVTYYISWWKSPQSLRQVQWNKRSLPLELFQLLSGPVTTAAKGFGPTSAISTPRLLFYVAVCGLIVPCMVGMAWSQKPHKGPFSRDVPALVKPWSFLSLCSHIARHQFDSINRSWTAEARLEPRLFHDMKWAGAAVQPLLTGKDMGHSISIDPLHHSWIHIHYLEHRGVSRVSITSLTPDDFW